MATPNPPSALRLVGGALLVVLGLAVFAIRLQHPGDYPWPRGGNLFGGLGALLLGVALLWRALPRPALWVVLALVPLVLFRGIYAIASELEEVVSLYATDADGSPAELRLWIVDGPEGALLGMPRAKAEAHSLDGAQVDMLRRGERNCVVATMIDDRARVLAMHERKLEKYAVARLSAAAGLYPSKAPETSVAVRVDPCPN